MVRKRLFCDIDSVLADFPFSFGNMLALKKDTFGLEDYCVNNKEQILDWDWTKWFPNITLKDIDEIWQDVANSQNFWKGLRPYPWTVGFLKILHRFRKELDVYFVTSRSQTAGLSVQQQSVEWLEKHGYPGAIVIPCKRKHELMQLLKVNFLIDDCPDYFDVRSIESLHSVYSLQHAYVVDYPYNRNIEMDNEGIIRRVNSPVEALVHIIDQL